MLCRASLIICIKGIEKDSSSVPNWKRIVFLSWSLTMIYIGSMLVLSLYLLRFSFKTNLYLLSFSFKTRCIEISDWEYHLVIVYLICRSLRSEAYNDDDICSECLCHPATCWQALITLHIHCDILPDLIVFLRSKCMQT